MKLSFVVALMVTVLVAACTPPTFGSVQRTPVSLPNGQLAYVYQGRANFPGQLAVADEMMASHCQSIGKSQAVIQDRQLQNLGAVSGINATSGMASGGVLANQNQNILFSCV